MMFGPGLEKGDHLYYNSELNKLYLLDKQYLPGQKKVRGDVSGYTIWLKTVFKLGIN